LGSALDLAQYDYCPEPENGLAWVGRISPEKGLEDAIAAATLAQQPLNIFGKVEDLDYWNRVQTLIAQSPISIDYGGFLPTAELQKALGRARALLVTPHWLEAFGIVAIEALACGVPVIAYRQGGLAEIVRSGETGWLVEAGDVGALVSAIARIDQIDRRQCRQQAETMYSLMAWGERFEQWFYQIVSGMISS
jgi:UDP-glucose:tetrahydrobiopterin glucosyltransferase